MRFPDSQRVTYERTPLVEVICQLRYSKILRIEKEVPSEFQDSIRSEYPRLEISKGIEVAMPMGSDAPPIALSRGQSYDFWDKERAWKLVLTSDFIALSTNSYTKWEVFRKRLTTAVDALAQRYGVSEFTRVGLRYKDVVIRNDLNLGGRQLRDLLRHDFMGILASDQFEENDFQEALSIIAFSLDDDIGECRVRHGLARKPDSEDIGYLIDADFYNENSTETANVMDTLDAYNREAGRLFRWCISDDLHEAMGPTPIP